MADQQEEKKDKTQEEDTAPKKSKKLLLIVVLLVLLLGGGGAYFFLFSGSGSSSSSSNEVAQEGQPSGEAEATATTPEATPENKDKPKEENKEVKDQKDQKAQESTGGSLLGKLTGGSKVGDFGDTINLKPFNINLGNPLENRYVRLELSLEYKGKDSQKQEIERRMPQLRDAIISVTGKKSREFLLSTDGKDQLRKELLIVINRYMSRPIEAVYITDILID